MIERERVCKTGKEKDRQIERVVQTETGRERQRDADRDTEKQNKKNEVDTTSSLHQIRLKYSDQPI